MPRSATAVGFSGGGARLQETLIPNPVRKFDGEYFRRLPNPVTDPGSSVVGGFSGFAILKNEGQKKRNRLCVSRGRRSVQGFRGRN